jgi:hypothetical protein
MTLLKSILVTSLTTRDKAMGSSTGLIRPMRVNGFKTSCLGLEG